MRLYLSVILAFIFFNMNAQREWKGIKLEMEMASNEIGELDPILFSFKLENTRRNRKIAIMDCRNFHLLYKEKNSDRWRALCFEEIHLTPSHHRTGYFKLPRRERMTGHYTTGLEYFKVGEEYDFILMYHMEQNTKEKYDLSCEKCVYSKTYKVKIVDYKGIDKAAAIWLKKLEDPCLVSSLHFRLKGLSYEKVKKWFEDFLEKFPDSRFHDWTQLHYLTMGAYTKSQDIYGVISELEAFVNRVQIVQLKKRAEQVLRDARGTRSQYEAEKAFEKRN